MVLKSIVLNLARNHELLRFRYIVKKDFFAPNDVDDYFLPVLQVDHARNGAPEHIVGAFARNKPSGFARTFSSVDADVVVDPVRDDHTIGRNQLHEEAEIPNVPGSCHPVNLEPEAREIQP